MGHRRRHRGRQRDIKGDSGRQRDIEGVSGGQRETGAVCLFLATFLETSAPVTSQ